MKVGWQDILLAFRFLAEALKNNILYFDSLLLLLDGLWKNKAQYVVMEQKYNITSFICPNKNVEAYGDTLYHGIVCQS